MIRKMHIRNKQKLLIGTFLSIREINQHNKKSLRSDNKIVPIAKCLWR